jgi:hypothetical protein
MLTLLLFKPFIVMEISTYFVFFKFLLLCDALGLLLSPGLLFN